MTSPRGTDVDLTEFVRLSRPKQKRCVVSTAAEQLDKPAREQLAAAIATGSDVITVGAIAEWLCQRGLETSQNAISAHRRGKCSCFRGG